MSRCRILFIFFFTTEDITFYAKHSSKIIHRIYSHSHKGGLTPPALAKTPVTKDHHIQGRDDDPSQIRLEEQIHTALSTFQQN